MKKRFLSAVLMVCVVLTLLPVHAFAATENDMGLALPKIMDQETSITWKATTLDGTTINQSTYSGKIQVLVFFLLSGRCSNSNKTLDALANSSLVSNDNVQIIALGVGNASADALTTYLSTATVYKDEQTSMISTSDKIVYAWITDTSSISQYFNALGLESTNYYAKNVILDAEGDVRAAWTGNYTADYYASTLELIGVEGVSGNLEGYRQYVTAISGTADYAAIQEELKYLNAYRQTENLSELTLDSELTAAAMQRAAELAIYYGNTHLRPDGTTCFTVSGKATRENIAAGYSSAVYVMNAWENSAGHNANILATDNVSVGLGCFIGDSGTKYWVQLFSNSESTEELTTSEAGTETFTVSVIAKNLSLSVSQSSVSLTEGSSAAITVKNANQGFNATSETVFATYTSSENKSVARASVQADGTVAIIPAGNGTTTVEIGLESTTSGGSPTTLDVTVNASGIVTTLGTTLTIDSGSVDLSDALVLAVTYESDGKMVDIVASEMQGDTVTFSKTLSAGTKLFFLDATSMTPLRASIILEEDDL